MINRKLSVRLDEIYIPQGRLRSVNESKAQLIADAIRVHGQLQPIVVYVANANKTKQPYTLVAGLHRYRALAILGWDEIKVSYCSANEARMVEIAENLFRNDLSQLERARFVDEWFKLKGVAFGRPRAEKSATVGQLFPERQISDEVAEKMGFSGRTSRRLRQIAQCLIPSLQELLVGTEAETNQTKLLKLAKFEPHKQDFVARCLLAEVDVDTAIRYANVQYGGKPGGRMNEAERQEIKLMDCLRKMSSERREAALNRFGYIRKPLDPWPKHFPAPTAIPAHGNNSPLWRMMENPYEALSLNPTYSQLEIMKDHLEGEEAEQVDQYDYIALNINAVETARREKYDKQKSKAKAAKSRKSKRSRSHGVSDTRSKKTLHT
jgi:ParB family transcriptional regulator, chromosome partitioning protein